MYVHLIHVIQSYIHVMNFILIERNYSCKHTVLNNIFIDYLPDNYLLMFMTFKLDAFSKPTQPVILI